MEKITDKKHARLGPSGWDWWSNCPGAPALSDGLPNTSNIYAAQGTVAHEVADKVLSEDITGAGEELGKTYQCDGFDIEVDDEMVEAVDLYVSIVRDHIGDGILMAEQQVPIGHLTGETGAEGTADCIGITNDGKRLVVIDLKYGKGVRVNAEGNGQGRMYALGALHKFGSVYEDIEEVEIVIVQPRLEEGITTEVLSIGELEEFKDEVELAAGAVELATQQMLIGEVEGLEILVPGEKQCRFCNAKAICPALKAANDSALALISDCSAEDFADLTAPKQASSLNVKPGVTNDKLAEFMRAVPLIEEAIKAARAEVERRLFDGQEIPGFYLGVGRKGNRKWASEDADGKPIDIENELKKRLGATQAYEKKVIGVPTAEKLFKSKPKTWAKIKGLIVQADGKPSVCQEGDKNPVYTPVTAADFADLSVETEAQRLLS